MENAGPNSLMGQAFSKAEMKMLMENTLIELVKSNPIIYQKSHPNHHHPLLLKNVWGNICKELNDSDLPTGEDCQQKWHSLWAQYVNYRRKLEVKKYPDGKKPYFRHADSLKVIDNLSRLPGDDSDGTLGVAAVVAPVPAVASGEPLANASSTTVMKAKPVSSDEIIVEHVGSLQKRDKENLKRPAPASFSTLNLVSSGPSTRASHPGQTLAVLPVQQESRDDLVSFGSYVVQKLKKIQRLNERRALSCEYRITQLILEEEKQILLQRKS